MFSGYGVPAFPSWFSATFRIIVVEVMTSGLPHVCKLWLGVSKGLLPMKHLTPRILKIMEDNYYWCQLARRLGWVVPACHKKDGATPHPGVCKFSLL